MGKHSATLTAEALGDIGNVVLTRQENDGEEEKDKVWALVCDSSCASDTRCIPCVEAGRPQAKTCSSHGSCEPHNVGLPPENAASDAQAEAAQAEQGH